MRSGATVLASDARSPGEVLPVGNEKLVGPKMMWKAERGVSPATSRAGATHFERRTSAIEAPAGKADGLPSGLCAADGLAKRGGGWDRRRSADAVVIRSR